MTLEVTPEIDLSVPPAEKEAAKGYSELYALWKSDEDAYNQGQRKSDADFLIWLASVRLHLNEDEKLLFDLSGKSNSVEEFRAEKAAALEQVPA